MDVITTSKIDYNMKHQVECIRLKYNRVTASHCFNSLAIWQEDMELSIYLEYELYSVRCKKRGDNCWFFPCGSTEAKIRFINRLIEQSDDTLSFVYMFEEDKRFLEVHFAGRFDIEESPDDSEYILDKMEQLELSGSRFHQMKKAVNKVTREYNFDIRPITPAMRQDIREITKTWSSHKDNTAFITDEYAVDYYLDHMDEMGGFGIVFYLEGEPFSVSAGFPLSDDTYDFLINKQKYPMGGFGTYSKYKFYQYLPHNFKYINMEEDLGIPGLRDMKNRLRPVKMITMYSGKEVNR